MKFKETIASSRGDQTLWSCAYCGSVLCAISRTKPEGRCPVCNNSQWHKTEPPVAMFEDIE